MWEESSAPSEGSGPEDAARVGASAPVAFWLMEPLLKNTGCACQEHRGPSQQPVLQCADGVVGERNRERGGWVPPRSFLWPSPGQGWVPGGSEWGHSAPINTPGWYLLAGVVLASSLPGVSADQGLSDKPSPKVMGTHSVIFG